MSRSPAEKRNQKRIFKKVAGRILMIVLFMTALFISFVWLDSPQAPAPLHSTSSPVPTSSVIPKVLVPTPESVYQVITGVPDGKLNVRDRPSISGISILLLSEGDLVRIDTIYDGWCYLPQLQGWVNCSYITLQED